MPNLRLILAIGLAALASSAVAQAPTPTPAPPVFASGTSLVHVDVVVTNKQGLQVVDLTAADFEIEASGKTFPATVARYVPLVDDEPKTGAAPPGTKLRASEVRRVITFIVARPIIETLGVSNAESNMLMARRVDRMFKRFIEREVKPRDLVAIVNADSRKPLLNQFTADPAALNLAMDLLRREWHNPDVAPLTLMPGSGREVMARYGSEVVELMEEVVRRLRDVPGRKLLFMVSSVLSINGPDFSNVKHEMETLIEHANRAGVTIYGVGPGGLGSGFSEALGFLADGTGGTIIGNTEFLGDGLGKIMELNRGYYLLGYDAEETQEGKPRRLKVRVKRPGLTIAARPQVYDRGVTVAETSPKGVDALATLLNSPLAATGINVRMTPYVRWTGKGAGEFQAVVNIDPKSLDLGAEGAAPSMDLTVLTRITDERGTVLKSDRVALKSKLKGASRDGIRLMVRAPLIKPGSYQADVAVQDERSGRFGNATALASLPDLSENRKGLAVSTLIMRPPNQPDALPSDTFEIDSPVSLSCRVANAKREPGREVNLGVQVRITRDGLPVVELEPVSLRNALPDLVDIKGEIPLNGLGPGDYAVEVEITDLLGDKGRNKVIAHARFTIVTIASGLS